MVFRRSRAGAPGLCSRNMDWPAYEPAADGAHEMLALVEAEVGSLVELLPVAVLVTVTRALSGSRRASRGRRTPFS